MRKSVSVFSIVSFIILIVFASSVLTPAIGKGVLNKSSVGNQEITEKLTLAEANLKFLSVVHERAQQLAIDAKFKEEIRKFPVEEKMAAFARALRSSNDNGATATNLSQALQDELGYEFLNAQEGGISGAVTVDGAISSDVEVIAFNLFGFFAGGALVDAQGNYTIEGLADGSYYVATLSRFVDEFYDNVVLDDFRNWRDAMQVTVSGGVITAGIDFDLQSGADVTGHVFQADGTTAITNSFIILDVFRANDPRGRRSIEVLTDAGGFYSLNVPMLGDFKIRASAPGLVGEFFSEQSSFENANIITISSFDDVIADVDFSLATLEDSPPEGGVIAGSVNGPVGGLPFSFVFAFNLADTTIAGFQVTDFSGNYTMPGLDDGDYVVYADNFLGFILPPALSGEYYEDAPTADLATPLTISGADTLSDINFTLEPGGSISGAITDNTGATVDNILVVAVKLDLQNVGSFFFDDIDFGVAFADGNGAYEIGGLSSGDYIVRTVSFVNSSLEIGPHPTNVLDEYYMNVQSLFDVSLATPVTVVSPQATENIDFELEVGGSITGGFFEVDGQTALQDSGFVIAFDDISGLPVLAFPLFDSNTSTYTVTPLPTGTFNLLGVVGLQLFATTTSGSQAIADKLSLSELFETANQQEEPVIYLPQFYNGKASLEEADPVPVTAPNVTAGIDFNFVRAGAIHGVVNLSQNFPVGADSLAETLVLAYDSATGLVAGGSDISFAGGFAIFGLAPGNYKVEAITLNNGYAATYHGGGTSFGAANSFPVSVAAGGNTRADINLATGEGVISGFVTNRDGTEPLTGVLVIAYDNTGHAVSAGISGPFPGPGSQQLQPGEYFIAGLEAGDYFVRTFSLFQIFLLLEELDLSGLGGGDPLTLLLGLLESGPDLLGGLDVQLFTDLWYNDEPVQLDLNNLDLFGLLFNLFLSGGDTQALIPFVDLVPGNAQMVSVTSPGLTSDVNFMLPAFGEDITTNVSGPDAPLPQAFGLAQNYPNPFNPTTLIQYQVPKTSEISLQIYNMLGQQIRNLFKGVRDAGEYTLQWNGLDDAGRQVAAGIYFLRMKSNNMVLIRKMLLVK